MFKFELNEILYVISNLLNSLKSEKLAHIAINELLPLLSTRQVDSATQVVIENFSNFSGEENDS